MSGSLLKAIKHGHWILIDEINLANNDVLQKIVSTLDREDILLYEKGDCEPIKIHEDFRIVGCMNPGNQVGKK